MFGPILTVTELIQSLSTDEKARLAAAASDAPLIEMVAEVNDERYGYDDRPGEAP